MVDKSKAQLSCEAKGGRWNGTRCILEDKQKIGQKFDSQGRATDIIDRGEQERLTSEAEAEAVRQRGGEQRQQQNRKNRKS